MPNKENALHNRVGELSKVVYIRELVRRYNECNSAVLSILSARELQFMFEVGPQQYPTSVLTQPIIQHFRERSKQLGIVGGEPSRLSLQDQREIVKAFDNVYATAFAACLETMKLPSGWQQALATFICIEAGKMGFQWPELGEHKQRAKDVGSRDDAKHIGHLLGEKVSPPRLPVPLPGETEREYLAKVERQARAFRNLLSVNKRTLSDSIEEWVRWAAMADYEGLSTRKIEGRESLEGRSVSHVKISRGIKEFHKVVGMERR